MISWQTVAESIVAVLTGIVVVWGVYDTVKYGPMWFPRNRTRPFTWLYFTLFTLVVAMIFWPRGH